MTRLLFTGLTLGTMWVCSGPLKASPTVTQTSQLFSSSSDAVVGIPQNNGAFWDGQRYWFIYSEGDTLKARYGTSLDNLSTTTIASGGGLVNNKTFSVVYGQTDGQWRAWALANRTGTAGQEFSLYRWDLTASGLANPVTRFIDITNKPEPTHVTLMPDSNDFDIQNLYGTIHAGSTQANQQTAARQIAPDLTSDAGLGGPVMSNTKFAEATWVFEVQDGLVLNGSNAGDFPFGTEVNGDFGHFSEWTRTGTSGSWSSEAVLDTTGPGNWRDMNYASHTSHAGQTDFVQLTDGTVFNAYIDNTDKTHGNYGKVVLKERGHTLASTWSTASLNAIDGGGEAWHLALTSDGRKLWLLYVKHDGSGGRDDAIFLRGYDPLTDTFTDETLIAQMTPGYRFERMTTQWRLHDSRLVVLWSQTNDNGLNLDVHATAVVIPEAGSLLGLFAGLGVAALRRPGGAARRGSGA